MPTSAQSPTSTRPSASTTPTSGGLSADDARVAAKVDEAFAGTPLAGLGELVVRECRSKRLPIDFVMAQLWKESSFVSPANNLTIANKNPGNLRWAAWEAEFGGKEGGPGNFTTFPSYEHGTRAYLELLATVYRDPIDRRDWGALIEKYAPSFENDTSQYIAQMGEWTANWQEKLGVGPDWANAA